MSVPQSTLKQTTLLQVGIHDLASQHSSFLLSWWRVTGTDKRR